MNLQPYLPHNFQIIIDIIFKNKKWDIVYTRIRHFLIYKLSFYCGKQIKCTV